MKNLKRLMAVVLTVVMLSTVSFAAAINKETAANYKNVVNATTVTQGTTTFTVDIGVEDITGADINIPAHADSAATLAFQLSQDALDAGIKVTDFTPLLGVKHEYAYVDEAGTYFFAYVAFTNEAVTVNKDTAIARVSFSAPADVATGTYKLNVYEGCCNITDGATLEAAIFDNGSSYDFVTVTAAAQKTPYSISDSINTNATIKGAEKTYTGVWLGTYTVTPNDDVITGITINGSTINKTLAEGEGQVIFKIAAIPAPAVAPTVTVNVAQ